MLHHWVSNITMQNSTVCELRKRYKLFTGYLDSPWIAKGNSPAHNTKNLEKQNQNISLKKKN